MAKELTLAQRMAGMTGELGNEPSKWGKGLKGGIGGLFAYMIMNRLMEETSNIGNRNLQREAIKTQGQAVTPESLYYQAALPQAQQEEGMARTALLSQLSGGIIGPSLAKGERLIGGG